MMAGQFRTGDRVVHGDKPEWGLGVVLSAEALQQGGAAAQRLRVRFERAGVKTLSAPPASLQAASEGKPTVENDHPKGWLESLESASTAPDEALAVLPESATDPFRPLAARLRATLDLYRFEPTGASLIDWAAAQTGLTDPLSRFSRHELEAVFSRFASERDAHLSRLASEARRAEPETLAAAASAAGPAAKRALARLDGRR